MDDLHLASGGMTPNPIQRLFNWKIRGVRWVEIIGFVCVGAMVFSVYLAKAAAARESAAIGQLERQIAENRQRVRLLRAEAARLEQPGRLEALSRSAGLAPVESRRQTTEAALPNLRPAPQPAPAPVVVEIPDAAQAAAAPPVEPVPEAVR